MNGMYDQDAFGETALRQALRLDVDERAPRLDAMALATAAERRTVQEQLLRALRGMALVGVGIAAEAAVALAAFNALSDLDLTWPIGVGVSLVAAVAQRIVVIGGVTANPSVGVAALAAVILATVYERTTGRESMRVRAS
jgi:hypothetical protein